MKRAKQTLLIILASASLVASLCYAQDEAIVEKPDAAGDSALGVRQQRVKRLMLDLERKFSELASKLEAEQPEQAQKLTCLLYTSPSPRD